MRASYLGLGLIAGLLAGSGAEAAPILYGNLNGSTVVYQHITEESTTDPGVALFGAPGIAGDSLTFSPTSFGINAVNGGFDFMDGTLTATMQAITGSHIDSIRFSERGDYTLGGTGTASTNATVSAALFVRILEVNGTSLGAPLTYSANLTFSPSGGTFNLVDDRGVAVIWNGAIEIPMAPILAANNVVGFVTKADFSLDNSLMAFSEPGTLAYIKKKQTEGITVTVITPEPGSLSLLMLAGLGLRRRRR